MPRKSPETKYHILSYFMIPFDSNSIKDKQPIIIKSRSVFACDQGIGWTDQREAQEKRSEIINILIIVVIQVYTAVKTHQQAILLK